MGQPTVLVVEDEPPVRVVLSLVLETRDYPVVTATDGAEALARVQADRPVVILLDMMLPTLDGWAVVETLYHTEQNGRIPIIAMSAGQFRADAPSSGATAFLNEPFDVQELLGILDETLKPTC